MSNIYQTGTTVQQQNALLTQSLNDTNAQIKAQIEADQQAFLLLSQNQANVIEFQNQQEQADEQLRIMQAEIERLRTMQNLADNAADYTFEIQRLEQERFRQEANKNVLIQAEQQGIQNAQQLSVQEQTQQQQLLQQAQLEKLRQVATATSTGAAVQRQTTATAKTTFANTGTTSKPTTTKTTATSTARTENETDTPDTPDENSNKFPLWAKIGLGVLGVGAVAGGAYYLSKKGKGKKGKDKGKNKTKGK